MTMSPALRKLALTTHVIAAVGWLGAVAAFLPLAVAGLVSQDPENARAVYLAMDLIGRVALVPLSLAATLTGAVSSLGTTWGLFKHYWVIAKIVLTVPATVLLLVNMQPVSQIAALAAKRTLSSADLGGLKTLLVTHSAGAVLVLLVVTAVSYYKPRGMTRSGWREQYEERTA
jgi:hypothetical protein